MSTIEEFKNAPIGATATAPNGNTAFKTGKSMFEWSVYGPLGRLCECLSSDEMGGYTLNPAAPATAREALALAWELSDPMKQGNDLPIGTECIAKVRDGEFMVYRSEKPFDGVSRPGWAEARTLDPLPEPEPEWRDARAVVALVRGRVGGRQVFARENEAGTRWLRETKVYRWDELIDVVPLYPREDQS